MQAIQTIPKHTQKNLQYYELFGLNFDNINPIHADIPG